jgi:hypothetical protein
VITDFLKGYKIVSSLSQGIHSDQPGRERDFRKRNQSWPGRYIELIINVKILTFGLTANPDHIMDPYLFGFLNTGMDPHWSKMLDSDTVRFKTNADPQHRYNNY